MENEKKLNEINDEKLTKISGGRGGDTYYYEEDDLLEKIQFNYSYRKLDCNCQFACVQGFVRKGLKIDGIKIDIYLCKNFNCFKKIGFESINVDSFLEEYDINNPITNAPWS